MSKPTWCVVALLALVASQLPAQRGGRGGGGSTAVQPSRFSYVGPDNGGRIAAVAGVPGDTSTYYFGAASGGIWKTTDGAKTFAPIFDDQQVQAIGALATAPSNPRIVWAGTGEAWAIRDADVMGDGVYKSTDAGATWQHMGLTETGRIGRIIIHPTNPNIVYVCALGRATGPQEERGVFRTLDGGTTWTRVLFVNPNTGCSGLSIDAQDPKTLFAGTWDVVMHTWAMSSGGPGSGVYVSHDSGSTWSHITDPGLPHSPVGKIDVAVAPSNSQRVYALIQTADQGSLWRSDDGGAQWKVVSWDRSLIGRAGYYIHVMVDPENDLEVLVTNSSFHRSVDGGVTFPFGGGCGDCHDIWMDPRNPSHWALTDDGGASITRDHGQNYSSFSLPVAQMYHVAIDDRAPYWVYGNRQDDGTMRGPNTSPVPVANVPSYGGGGRGGRGGGRGGAAPSAWQAGLGGCESGFTLPMPGNPDIVWATCYGNKVTRYDDKSSLARSVGPGNHTLDSPPDKAKYRCHWTPPLAIDPFDPNTVYYGCQVIFKTSNAGQSWKVISPDLSTNDPSRIVSSGGIIGDNLGQFYGEVVFAIAPSEVQKGLIWAGTNDGKVWYTADGGGKWNDVTRNVTGMAPWGTIRKIEPSRFDARTAYMVVDYHIMDDRKPYIFKTTDLGKSWTRISDGLPQDHPLAYAMSLAENPNRKGMLFVGTGNAMYYSLNDGAEWKPLQTGLPAAPVSWITVAKHEHDLVVSTYGRGIYVMHDITPLEQADKVLAGAPVHLFTPRAGMRNARNGSAELQFTLASAPKDSVRLEVVDSSGATVRTLTTMGRAGTNRISWDLRYEPPQEPELRTTPPDNPHIWDEPRFKDKVTRPILHWGIEGAKRTGPLAAPGQYTFRLHVDTASYAQPFTVAKNPDVTSSTADLQLSTGTQQRIRDDLTSTSGIVNSLEIVRKQIEDYLATDSAMASVRDPLRALNQQALDVEMQLLTKSDLHSDDKWFVEQYKVYLNLVWLNGLVGTGAGDVAGGADYRPTDAAMEELDGLDKQLAAAKAAYTTFMTKTLADYNQSVVGQTHPVREKLPVKPGVILP